MELLTLENGLRIILDEAENARSATLGVWVAAGSRYENEKNNGISHFIEHIVFKGSTKRTAFEIAEGMDSIGALVNAYTTKEYTFFYTKALDYQILSAADILLDMVKNPRLDEKDIETEKGVICEEIAMCEDDPSDVCYEANENAIYCGTSLALDILGSKESISALCASDFKEYMKKYYVPERTVVGVSGKFDKEAMLSKIKEYFENDVNTNNPLVSEKIEIQKKYTLLKKQFEQNHLMLSFPGIEIKHEDLYALQLCMFILGNSPSSKLNQRIREQLGLVYEISSWLVRYLKTGYIAVSMSLNASSEETALRETCSIIRNFAEQISEKELSAAKEKLIASLIMNRELPQSKLSSLGYMQLMLSTFDTDDGIINEIKSVTPQKLKETAKKYLVLEKASFVAVGNVKDEEFYKKIIEGEKS